MKATFLEKFLYIIVFLISLVLYFNAFSVIAYVIFVVATLGLLYYDIRLVKKFREKTTWKKIQSVFEILISVFIVLIFIFVVHVYPNLCTVGPNNFAKNYFTGEVKGFYCGITPWYYQKLQGQEEKDARSKAKVVESQTCRENLANNPLYQKMKSGTATFDNLTGNFAQGAQSLYLQSVAENTFGIIGGINYGFDFSAGQRTSDLANADIILENEKIKSTSGNLIYLGNVERISTNRGPLQEFHLRDTVFDTQPVDEVNLKDFGFAFVKTREGNFAKVKLSTYSVDNRDNSVITIFWAYQPNGTKSLKSDYTDFVKELDTYCNRNK